MFRNYNITHNGVSPWFVACCQCSLPLMIVVIVFREIFFFGGGQAQGEGKVTGNKKPAWREPCGQQKTRHDRGG